MGDTTSGYGQCGPTVDGTNADACSEEAKKETPVQVSDARIMIQVCSTLQFGELGPDL